MIAVRALRRAFTCPFTWRAGAVAIATGALVGVAGAAGSSIASCAQTPTAIPIQTFDRPQNIDVVCLHVNDGAGNNIIPPIPEPQALCPPVPENLIGNDLPYHLYALVTQTVRGQVAAVDLTGGYVVDTDYSTPGINLLAVGTLPSDIASAPDGKMSYVGSANPNAPAIYALPSTVLLGDSLGPKMVDGGAIPIPELVSWPVCALPQAPGAIAIVPTSVLNASALRRTPERVITALDDAGEDAGLGPTDAGDAGQLAQSDAGDAGELATDAGAVDSGAGSDAGEPASGLSGAGYLLAVVLPGDSSHPARVGLVDPAPLIRGAGWEVPNSGVAPDPSATDTPGALVPCTFVSYVNLTAPPSTTTWTAGPAWDDGVKYVDGGMAADQPQATASCVALPDAGFNAGGATVAGVSGAPIGSFASLDLASAQPIYYVADSALPIIHRLDVSDPTHVKELAPLLATSVDQPQRVISVGQIAVSPSTRDFKRFLYAIDVVQGSLMVYDVSDPVNGPLVPMRRPHPELDPFQPSDRIIFTQPVATIAFARHDWPITQEQGIQENAALSGVLCNPNPAIDLNVTAGSSPPPDQGAFSDPGGYYRANAGNQELILGPMRLRGIFAFATLSNGEVATIDVDDWDAPCRRPDPMAPRGTLRDHDGNLVPQIDSFLTGPFNAISPPQPDGGTDPYHAPYAWQSFYGASPVTLEAFFPISAPHTTRSYYLLNNDPVNGNHAPNLIAPPQLFQQGAPVPSQGVTGILNPNLVPTDTAYVDPDLQTNPTTAYDPATRAFSPVSLPPAVLVDAGADAAPITVLVDAGAAYESNGTLVIDSPRGQSFPTAPSNLRFAFEDPHAQIDQDWTVTYEGQLPGFFDSNGNSLVIGDISTTDGYQTITFSNASVSFCGKGIEDFAVGTQRAQATMAALASASLPPATRLDHKVADYVYLTDNQFPIGDQYWALNDSLGCWAGLGDSYEDPAAGPVTSTIATNRQQLCYSTYGIPFDSTDPSPQRDFPILEAHDDHLVVGRFAPSASGGREIVGPDPSNVPFMKLMQCCFHSQVSLAVRAGSEWVAVGSNVGMLNHSIATGPDARCVPSCDPRATLLNSRAPAVPRPPADANGVPIFTASIDRDNPLAMRNPMFSFIIWNGQDPSQTPAADVTPVRDMVWQFSTRGQFVPLDINLAATTSNLSPQSMLFIDTFGQLAVIDGESQGLILIDLDAVALAHAPYF